MPSFHYGARAECYFITADRVIDLFGKGDDSEKEP